MNLKYIELLNLLEERNELKISKFLKRTKAQKLFKEKSFFMLNAITYQSVSLVKFLLMNNYPVEEQDEIGRTTYNYLMLYGTEKINELLKEKIIPNDKISKEKEMLLKMRTNIKYVTTISDLIKAHRSTFNNCYSLFVEQECVCVYCKERFSSSEIVDFSLSSKGTALCPYCGIDSVVGEFSGYDLSDNFIKAMHEYFFNNAGEYSNHFMTRL